MVGLILGLIFSVGPQPGDAYREYAAVMGGGLTWRITDPQAKHPGAKDFLPNRPVELQVDDLKGARRAELLIDRWGGHAGTTGKKLRLNENVWIDVPPITTTPPGTDASCFASEDSPIVEVPLDHLRQGRNKLEGTAGHQVCDGFGWGQWGWYGAILRVYYDGTRPHPAGKIAGSRKGGHLDEYPQITVDARGASPKAPVTRVDVVAYYDGYDENGDGNFADWHESYHYGAIADHVGSALVSPFKFTWDTRWVPDQAPASIKLVARIRDATGLWWVTPVVDGLTLDRAGTSVKLYKPRDVPPKFWVRADKRKSSRVNIPETDSLKDAAEAALHLRAWNGVNESFEIGAYKGDVGGVDHNFSYMTPMVPLSALQPGDNKVTFYSITPHHGIEVLWPGPGLTVRYGKIPARPAALAADRLWVWPDCEVRVPVEVSAGPVLRDEYPVEVDLDFNALTRDAGVTFGFVPGSVRVVEVSSVPQGAVVRIPDAWQLDMFPGSPHKGRLTFLMPPSGPDRVHRYHVYFASSPVGASPLVFPSRVSVEDGVAYEGQESFRVTAPGATYLYHKEGGGFASLLDKDGKDWVSYHAAAGSGSKGEFRGIPNLGVVGHPGYTGEKGVQSVLTARGPIKATIESRSRDGKWAWSWDIFPNKARLSIEKSGAPYWFLYEGTPGGAIDPDSDYLVFADGKKRPAPEAWHRDLPAPEWLYFGDVATARALFLAKHADDDSVDQYWPMENNMTVFGFGREYKCCGRYLNGPAQFTLGFVDPKKFNDAHTLIEGTWRPVNVAAGTPERRYAAPRQR